MNTADHPSRPGLRFIPVLRGAAGRPGRAALGGLLVAALLLAGCSATGKPGTGKPDPATVRPTAAPPSAWQSVLDRIGANGEVDLDTARQAFALAVAPLPGVTVPAGARGTIRSATAAVRWVLAHLDELTPEQRTAVAAALTRSDDDIVIDRPGATKGGTGGGAPAGSPAAPHRAPSTDPAVIAMGESIDEAVGVIAGRLGRPLRQRLRVLNPAKVNISALGQTASFDAKGDQAGAAVVCRLAIPASTLTMSHEAIYETVLHEVFHCFQTEAVPTLTDFYSAKLAPWIVEGSAEWAGDSLASSAEQAATHWFEYLTDAGKSLFSRSYDAIGYYSHLDESGISPWRVIDSMMRAAVKGGNRAAFSTALAGGDAARFLNSWPSGYARGRRPGPEWDTTGPGITADRVGFTTSTITGGASATVVARPAGNGIHLLDLSAEIVTFAVPAGAHGRLGPASGPDVLMSKLAGTWCTKPGGCGCPGEPAGAASALPALAPGVAWLAVTGAPGAAKVTVTGTALDTYCKRRTELVNCMTGSWTTTRISVTAPHIRLRGGAGVILRIDPAGNGTVKFDAMKPIKGTIGATAPSEVSFRYRGSTSFKQQVRADGTVIVTPGRFDVSAVGTMSLLGASIPFSFPLGGLADVKGPAAGVPQKPFGDAAASCTATTLTRTEASSGVSLVGTWKRL